MTTGPKFSPVQPVRAYERIVEQVEDALASGDLVPGQRLPSERELVAQFAVSRSTVREALRVLESNGVVRSRPGDPNGPEILPFSQSALRKQMVRLARVDELTLSELIGFRMIMDGAAIQVASRLRTPEELDELEETLVAMRAAIDVDFDAFSQADLAFHELIARISRNSLIQTCNEVVRGVVLSLISDKISHAPNSRALMLESLHHHADVVDAIRTGNGHAAARLARQNMYDYYGGYVPDSEQETLRALVED
ncbi:DNA-binding FadR family transcriptional regulator [Kribbella rubisoli]|jgi:GntR family transcriptional regulator, transcriptional repressor for pyruvate dehydrogenase complex|uniref:DNA-binding FadR family transcriptional regulator n=1 Tax=Kribbella rubisoli TaxID=3075929 RepID=A0A4Q7XFN3_9ACTN|nr:FadR/GntR family transcriptional regulator [Kribbella rubisoli]RZU22332.1 DNA-binding FadR family transcriptional regulator [Kribbella rubisoli]